MPQENSALLLSIGHYRELAGLCEFDDGIQGRSAARRSETNRSTHHAVNLQGSFCTSFSASSSDLEGPLTMNLIYSKIYRNNMEHLISATPD
jgi:hypothetical protein